MDSKRKHRRQKKKFQVSSEDTNAVEDIDMELDGGPLSEQSLTMSHLTTELQAKTNQYKRLEIVVNRLAEEMDDNSTKLKVSDSEIRELKYMVQHYQTILRENGISYPIEFNKTIMPGVSEEMAKTLRMKNAHLQEHLNYSKNDYSHLQQLTELSRSLLRQIEQMNKNLEESKMEIVRLENTLSGSKDVKDKEIILLRDKNKKFAQKQDMQEIICDQMFNETETLKVKLKKTEEELSKAAKYNRGSQNSLVPAESVDDNERKAFKAELVNLRQKFKEVVELNKKWQIYHNEQSTKMKNLMSRNNELENIIKTTVSGGDDHSKVVFQQLADVNTQQSEKIQHEKASIENLLKKTTEEKVELRKKLMAEEKNGEVIIELKRKLNEGDEVLRVLRKDNQDLRKKIDDFKINQSSLTISSVEKAANTKEFSVLNKKYRESCEQNVRWQSFSNAIEHKMKALQSRVIELEDIVATSAGNQEDKINELLETKRSEIKRLESENNMLMEQMNERNEMIERLHSAETTKHELEWEQSKLLEHHRKQLEKEQHKTIESIRKMEQFRHESKVQQADNKNLKQKNLELQITLSKLGPPLAGANINPVIEAHYTATISSLKEDLEAAQSRITQLEGHQTRTGSGLAKFQAGWSAYNQYQQRALASSTMTSSYQQIPILARSLSQKSDSLPVTLDNPSNRNSPPISPDNSYLLKGSSQEKGKDETLVETQLPCPYCGVPCKQSQLEIHKKNCHKE